MVDNGVAAVHALLIQPDGSTRRTRLPTDTLSRLFGALADPIRRDIIDRLADGDATVNELASHYAVTLQAVSKHLKVLEGAGLVSRRRDAQRRPVHLEPEVLDPVTELLAHYRRRAEARYQRLDALLASLPDLPDHHTKEPDL